MTQTSKVSISGHVSAGYESVREAFHANFTDRHELGGACCVYRRGEKVVDLWGGLRNEATGAPWEADTMVLVYSATKGLAAMTFAIAHSRGWLDYEERVSRYWPEFAQQGKDAITVRQLLAHQAGLFAFKEQADRCVLVHPPDRLAGLHEALPGVDIRKRSLLFGAPGTGGSLGFASARTRAAQGRLLSVGGHVNGLTRASIRDEVRCPPTRMVIHC